MRDEADADGDEETGGAGGASGSATGGGDGSDEHGAVPVEAVEDLSPAVAAGTPEYVLYGGKGGVGKTTMAAATGIASAEAGTPTLVVSTDPAHSLGDTFDAEVGPEPTRVAADHPLYAGEIDPEDALDEAGVFGAGGDLGGLESLFGGLGPGSGTDGPAADGEGAAGAGPAGADGDGGLGADDLPGADEAAAMQQLLRFLDDDRFDRVVVDTAPTGHTLRLLELPEVLEGLVGQFARLRQRLSGMLGAVPGVGDGGEGPDLDEVAARVERLRGVLRDADRTEFRVVAVPELSSVRESTRLVDRLERAGIPVGTVVVNRVMEPFEAVVEGSAGVDPDAFVAPDLESCAFCARRWESQRAALDEATPLFRGRSVARVPLFAAEVRGPTMLRAVAACLSSAG
ncbi:MAG: ArsA family ATPase [Halobacteriaceae archaeon]